MNDLDLYRQLGLGRWQMLQRGASSFEATHFHPPTNVHETEESVVITVEVAGLREGEYEIVLSEAERVLTIVGRRQPPLAEGNKVVHHRLEIQAGSFAVQVDLPAALEQGGQADASYVDGFLVVTLPKAKARHVPVRLLNA